MAETTNNQAGNRRKSYNSPLEDIQFERASQIVAYGDTMRAVGRAQQRELHTAADELQAALQSSVGNFMERAAARRKARKTSNVLRRAADGQRSLAVAGVRFKRVLRREYAMVLNPPKKSKKAVINWKE